MSQSSSETIQNQLQALGDEFNRQIISANETKIEELRIEFLGKKGQLTGILKSLASLEPENRSKVGAFANKVKAEIEERLQQRVDALKQEYYDTVIEAEYFDVTALRKPLQLGKALGQRAGNIHPISITQMRLEEIFTSMGFSIMDGPQVETDFNNFGALNFTDDHPARDMQDTFYTTEGNLLRTHTSAVQVRAMKKLKPPMRMIVPGRVFRYEEIDASHEHTFYQMEGMIIDKEVSVSHLLFMMKTLLKEIFADEVVVRLRPGYFPFVEPGFELDMQCLVCHGTGRTLKRGAMDGGSVSGTGCSVCKQSGWVEVLPCGLVHPNVLRSGGLDPDQWQGAAFGLGLNRLVMMQHGIEDIRYFQNANPEFLRQFLVSE